MGDRFSFGVTDRGGDVIYLYSHWGGDGWDKTLRSAILKAGLSVGSTERANRTFISWLIGDNWQAGQGYAISINRPTDTEYGFIPVVDFNNSKISFYEYEDFQLGDNLLSLSLNNFLQVKDIDAMLAYARGEIHV